MCLQCLLALREESSWANLLLSYGLLAHALETARLAALLAARLGIYIYIYIYIYI